MRISCRFIGGICGVIMLCAQTLQTEAAQLLIGSFLLTEASAARSPMAADSPAAMGDLAADLFADPTNLQLNFALLKQPLTAGIISLSAKARFLHQIGGHHLVVLQDCRCIHGL